MLLIDNAVVETVLRVEECIATQEQAFADLLTGRSIHRPRLDVYAPCDREDGYYRWSSMEGVTVRPGPYFAIRVKSDIAYWPRSAGGAWTEKKYCAEPGRYCGLILLFSTRNGAPLAIVQDGVLQHLRTGAGAGIGAKYLARRDAARVGILGSGGMARSYLHAFAAVRPLQRVRVYSPTASNREAFARALAAELEIEVQAVGSAEEAVRGADIVATCTDSMRPVLDAAWLEPGMHVTNVGPAEIDEACYGRFDVIVRQGAPENNAPVAQNGRLRREVGLSPIAYVAGTEEEMRRLPPVDPGRRGFGGEYPHAAQLIAGEIPGRTSDEQITFYHNFGNQGLQFACIGGLVYEQALAAGLGRELPDDWFLESVRN